VALSAPLAGAIEAAIVNGQIEVPSFGQVEVPTGGILGDDALDLSEHRVRYFSAAELVEPL
jgi:hypothetical protein